MINRISFFVLGLAVAVTGARADLPAAGLSQKLPEWRKQIEAEVHDDILPFWIQHTVDHQRGGFYGEVTNDLQVKADAERGALLTSRILWTYSHAYRHYHDPADLQMARWAYDDLLNRFWDKQHGGFFWSASADGKPLEQEKQTYGQAFGIYSLAEYFLATQERAALDRAIEVYRLLQQHALDPKNGGYWEVFHADWTRDLDQHASPVAPDATKSQNTHLHVFEAFTNLLRAWPDPGLRQTQRQLVEVMTKKILNPKTHHLILYQDDDWTPKTSDISYGHDIEFSWLLVEAGDVLGDAALKTQLRAIAVDVARATLDEGLAKDGSLPYEASPEKVTNPYREWWPQAEAMVGFCNAYQLSGDKRFLAASELVWNYIETKLIDHRYGEWFAGRLPDGKISPAPKVSLWKCPYHNGRACFEMMERLGELTASTAQR